jgi:hypothetical protein
MDTEQPSDVIQQTLLGVLAALYEKLCNCRKNYEELDNIVDPKFHLEECEYRIALDRIGFKYE